MTLLATFLNELKTEQAQKQAIRKQNAGYSRSSNGNRYNRHQRKQLDPIAFYSGFGFYLKRGQKQQKVKCPFHDDKNPSMSINTDTGEYFCFSCGEGGGMVTFYMNYKHVDFKTACRELNI